VVQVAQAEDGTPQIVAGIPGTVTQVYKVNV